MLSENMYVGKRVVVDDYFGTIRYHGSVDGKPGLWFGIEWDVSERGKNSGTVGGKSYFTTAVPNAGSFISAQKDISFGQGFLDALQEKYLGVAATGPINIGSTKDVETVGWEKMQSKLSKLDKLVIVGLAGSNVLHEPNPDLITNVCPSIEDLDLSRNLFTSLDQVASICQHLKKLEIIRLNRNRFFSFQMSNALAFSNVKVLTLVDANLSWNSIQTIEQYFPMLEELHVGSNNIDMISATSGFLNLKVLNLEHNALTKWEQVEQLGLLPRLQSLNMATNSIDQIKPSSDNFKALKFLNINNNQIKTWVDIHHLNTYPMLTELRSSGNPICVTIDIQQRLSSLVGRLAKMTRIEGSSVSSSRRRDSECYYLNQAHLDIDKPGFQDLHPRYQELCEIHGTPVTAKLDTTVADRLIQVTLKGDGNALEKKLPKQTTVRAFKTIIARSLQPKTWQKALTGTVVWHNDGKAISMTDELKSLDFYGVSSGDSFCIEPKK